MCLRFWKNNSNYFLSKYSEIEGGQPYDKQNSNIFFISLNFLQINERCKQNNENNSENNKI